VSKNNRANRQRKQQRAKQAQNSNSARPRADGVPSNDPLGPFYAQFKDAAGHAALIELKLRMLADKIPGLERYAHEHTLANVEKQLVAWFGAEMQKAEADLLEQVRVARNKLLHGDFRTARELLHGLGVPEAQGGVRLIEFQGRDAGGMLAQIDAAAGGEPGSFSLVSDAASTADGGIFGWLLELGNAGYFPYASEVFKRAAGLVDRLAVRADDVRAAREAQPA